MGVGEANTDKFLHRSKNSPEVNQWIPRETNNKKRQSHADPASNLLRKLFCVFTACNHPKAFSRMPQLHLLPHQLIQDLLTRLY